MKQSTTLCAFLAATALPASAVVVFSDNFSYADGPLAGNGSTGSGWAGAWAISGSQGGDGNMIAASTVLTAANVTSPQAGQFDSRPVNASFVGSSNSLYFGGVFQNNVPSGNYAQWIGISGAANPSNVNAGPFIQFGLANGQFSLRANTGASTTDAGTYTPGTIVSLVGRANYDASGSITDVVLWNNPASEADTPIASATGLSISGLSTITGASVGNFVFSGASTGTIDDLVFATEFNDIIPVPEPSSAVLSLLGALGLLTARRR